MNVLNENNNLLIDCILQARMGSTRLPGKPLLKINNKTIINHVYENVKKIKDVTKLVKLAD